MGFSPGYERWMSKICYLTASAQMNILESSMSEIKQFSLKIGLGY